MTSKIVLICICLMLNTYLSVCQIFEITLLWILCLDLYPCLIGLFDFLICIFLISLYILDIRLLLDIELVKLFSHSVGCWFLIVLLTVSFALNRQLDFMRSHLGSVPVLCGQLPVQKFISCDNVFTAGFPLSLLSGLWCLVLS